MSYGYSNGNDMVMPVTPMGYGNGGNGNGGYHGRRMAPMTVRLPILNRKDDSCGKSR